jgi:hypothetical protein
MTAPRTFAIQEPFKHKSPEIVRETVTRHGFALRTAAGTSDSEIWVKAAEGGGFWIVRLDTMGHDTRRHFGARPHYHKNWVESDDVLRTYLEKFTPKAWIYSDAGIVLGEAGPSAGMHPDRKAKLQHIPR